MRFLVTGGAGYIGAITVRVLLDAGHEATVIDSLVRGQRAAIDPRARFVEGDVGDAAAVRTALADCDAVLHCAGLIEVAESQTDPLAYWDANVARPLVLLAEMRDAGIDALVFSSTAAVYGEPTEVPIPETALTRPINVYGQTKLALEDMIVAAERAGDLRAIRFRYFNVGGALPDATLGEAHQPETHIIPRILRSLAAGIHEFEVFGSDYPTPDGTCVRDYIHVLDLARAHMLALERVGGGGAGGLFNLGSGSGFSNLEVVTACATATDTDISVIAGPRRPGDPAQLVADSTRARAELGWVPERTDLPTIVGDAWRWHRAHNEGAGASASKC